MRARYALIIAVLCVAALAVAQDQRAPWPSEYFNPKPPANTAGDFDYYALVLKKELFTRELTDKAL